MGSKQGLNKGDSITKSDTSKHSVRSRASIFQEQSNFKDPRHITVKITIESCENVRPFFPVADIQARCIVGENVIGESRPVPITDAQTLPIEYTFEFQIDRESHRDMDALVTYPAFLMFDQIQGTMDRHIYPQLQVNELLHTIVPAKSFDSIVSLYEALGSRKSISETLGAGSGPDARKRSRPSSVKPGTMSKASLSKDKSKIKKESKVSVTKERRSSSNSKSSISFRKQSRSSIRQSVCSSGPSIQFEPTIFGMCIIDFLPLIFGEKKLTQCMLIKPTIQYQDDKMNSFKSHPKATITLWTEDEFEVPNPTILNFTVETVYNIPMSVMTQDMEYRICCVIPMLNGHKMPMLFSNPVILSETRGGIPKCWPGIQRIGNDTNTTQYRTPDDLKDINAKFDNVESYITMQGPRLQFTMIKRHLLFKNSVDDIVTHVKLYRNIVLEFVMSPRQKRSSVQSTKVVSDTVAAHRKMDKSLPYLHLMAILDISTLLYPGVSRVRVGAPLTTFSLEEASKYGGLEDSFFFPFSKEVLKSRGKDDAPSPEKTKEEKLANDHNLKYKLPLRPEELTDPIPVYDEQGRPCFVIVELELTSPLIPPKNIEDLTADVSKLIIAKNKLPSDLSKVVLTSCMTINDFKEVLNSMVHELNHKYIDYLNENYLPYTETGETRLNSFVDYLKKSGIYPSYVHTISKVVSMLIRTKFRLDLDNKNDNKYEQFIGEIFVYLMSQMNETVNKLTCHGMEPVSVVKHIDKNYFYAKEAIETGRQAMAERYLLERICNDYQNADFWFDYGVYLLQIKEDDKAFECIKEALSKQMHHKYSVLTLGALLNSKEQNEEAETCLLNLMDKECFWVEGWAVLYLFYLKTNNYEGMDMAMEMAKKYLELAANEQDEFMEADELVWTKAICPNTIFFRTAFLLLKCRLYEWSELALSQEISTHPGLVHYLLSAICYYKKLYNHALDHIEETKKIYGPDYAVANLAGHCYLALGRKEEAKQQYYWAMEFFNRPVSNHLACVQLAKVLDDFGEIQEARKLALVACKYNPTPYTWLLAGKYYYQQNDLLSAEECFSEGNSIDNRYAEIWGYLALVNAKLKRASEAEICYNQAIRNKLDDKGLLRAVEFEMSTLNNRDFGHVY